MTSKCFVVTPALSIGSIDENVGKIVSTKAEVLAGNNLAYNMRESELFAYLKRSSEKFHSLMSERIGSFAQCCRSVCFLMWLGGTLYV